MNTLIRAPFSGVITERMIARGQIVSEGESLFRLIDDQSLTLEVALGEQQWRNLATDWQGQIVALYSTNKLNLGKAILARGGDILDSESRQYSLYLDVTPTLRGQARAGQFVQVLLPGRTLAGVFNLPESALSQDGTIWLINADNKLLEYQPEFYFRQSDRVLVAPPAGLNAPVAEPGGQWRIAIRPLGFFLNGKPVTPKLEPPANSLPMVDPPLFAESFSNQSSFNQQLSNQ